jgi:fused signal recognition particle receptor
VPEAKVGFFQKIKDGLSKTRAQFATQIEWIVKGKPIEEDAFDEVEEALILADTGLETAEALKQSMIARWKLGDIKTNENIRTVLAEEVEKLLLPVQAPLDVDSSRPFIILILGVNGVGKTTTIAKLTRTYMEGGKSVLLGACDTFRAAAIEQLEVWAGRLGCDVIKHKDGADPAAVAYDATVAARSRNVDVLILDTAGRLHTKVNLMEEMKKIKRVVGKEMEGAPHETLLVVDATNGQNVIAQAKAFQEALGLTGLIITKLDGTAKGGFVLPIAHLLNIPIRYIGVGEKMDDLIPFDAREFAKALVE